MQLNQIKVDVYSWAFQAEQRGTVPFNGLFRHAYLLAQRYTPAVLMPPDVSTLPERGLALIQAFLNKPIERVDHKTYAGIWLSIGVDQCCPKLLPPNAFKVAILHDTMSVEGVFGQTGVGLFESGASLNDAFLFVSHSSLDSFKKWSEESNIVTSEVFVPYGCTYGLGESPTVRLNIDRSGRSLSVHTLFKYKKFFHSLRIARQYGLSHTHVGAYGDEDPAYMKRLLTNCHPYTHDGAIDDAWLLRLYQSSEVFICMSSMEGFSIPPLEAIVNKVPIIILSDIPVHREIYAKYNVNFFPSGYVPRIPLEDLSVLRQSDVDDANKRFSFPELIAPFEQMVAKL